MLARARIVWLTLVGLLVTVTPSSAAPFQPGNLVVSRPSGAPPTVSEYTPSGELVQSVGIMAGTGGTRGSVIDGDGRLHAQVGSAAPGLFTWDRATDGWSSRVVAGWSTAECASCGGVGVGADHLYATDVVTSGAGAANGLIRFDAEGSGWQRFATGVDYSDVAVGGDGLIYARRADRAATIVDVFDPGTLARLRSVTFAHPCVAFEADESGNLFGVFGVSLVRYAPTGAVLGGRSLPITGSLIDLARSPDGRLAVTTSGGLVLVVDVLGNVLQSFAAGVAGHVAFVPTYQVPVVCTDSVGPSLAGLDAARERDATGAACVRASWTAPADSMLAPGDGACVAVLRAAASYDLRWSIAPIDGEAAFASATAVDGEPAPGEPGAAEGVVVCGVPEDVELHLALRAFDAEGNASAIATARVEAVPADTIPTDRPCPLGWPHWQNATAGWPETITLGDLTYSSDEARALLGGVHGDASRVLARQLVAAKLNLHAGADPEPVAEAVAEADALVGDRRLPIGVEMNSDEGHAMRDLAKRIQDYNHGKRSTNCPVFEEDGEVVDVVATSMEAMTIGRIAPNPFTAAAQVPFELRSTSSVRVVVYDLQGRVRRVLADADFAAGSHVVTWDGTDANGVRLPRGVYLIRAAGPGTTSVRKIVLGGPGR